MSLVNKAIQFAKEAHGNQKRRDGLTPYWKHPEALVGLLQSWGVNDEKILSAGWLHDCEEDTTVTEDDIEAAFGKEVSDMVHELTHRLNEEYQDYIKRISKSNSLIIKLADIIVNLSDDPTVKQTKKYSEALKIMIPLMVKIK